MKDHKWYIQEINALENKVRNHKQRADKAELRAENLATTLAATRKELAKLFKSTLVPQKDPEQTKEELYVVRLYDGMDGEWLDISDPINAVEAMRIWKDKTKNATENTVYEHIDYYAIFPADMKMVFSDGLSQTRGDNR